MIALPMSRAFFVEVGKSPVVKGYVTMLYITFCFEKESDSQFIEGCDRITDIKIS